MGHHTEVMEWRGCEVVDRDGDKVGKLDEIYLDRQTGQPEWAIVNTGLFGQRSSFVPLKDAMREGDMIRVPYEKDQIKDAPNVDADGELTQEEEQQVYAHYGLDYSQDRSQSGLPESGGTTRGDVGQTTSGDVDQTTAGDVGQTTSGGTGRSGGDVGEAGPGETARTASDRGESETDEGESETGGELRLKRFVREEVRIDDESGDSVREERITTSKPGQDS